MGHIDFSAPSDGDARGGRDLVKRPRLSRSDRPSVAVRWTSRQYSAAQSQAS